MLDAVFFEWLEMTVHVHANLALQIPNLHPDGVNRVKFPGSS